MKIHNSDSAADLARQLATAIAQRLRAAIQLRGHAALAVSGGKSPIALFEALRVLPLKWQYVTVMLVDERCVPHDHPDSNTGLVRRHLLQDAAAAATFTPFFDTLPETLDDAALNRLVDTANRRLTTQPWPMDMAVLGMGDDGHTASLFPGAPGLHEALHSSARVAWVRPSNATHARLTLTLSALLAAHELALSISGASKLAVFQQARLGADETLPVSLILTQHQTPVSVWLA